MWPDADEREVVEEATKAVVQALGWLEDDTIELLNGASSDRARYLRLWIELVDRVAARGYALEMQTLAQHRSARMRLQLIDQITEMEASRA